MARGYKIADGYMEITADHDKADREINGFFRSTDGKLRDMRGRFVSEGSLAGKLWSRELSKEADKGSRMGFRGLAGQWGKKFATMGAGIGKLFANKLVLAAVAGLGALPQAVGAISSAVSGVVNIGGAFAALAPAAIGSLALTMTALKTAFSGLGEALKAGLAGDMAALSKATKDMAPAMQQAVRALVQLNPLVKELKKTVQQGFWTPFVNDIKPLAQLYLPMVYAAMAQIAAGFGQAAHQVAAFLLQSGTAKLMAFAFQDISLSVRNITSGLGPLVQAFLMVFQVGASMLPGLTEGFAGLATTLRDFIASAAASGALMEFIQNGVDSARALGRALADVLGILRSIGDAAPSNGLFAAIAQLLDMVNRFFHTIEGQAVLASFFEKLQVLGQIVLGLVKGALPGLLALSSALLQGLSFLAPVAETVGKAIGDVLTAVAPVLPILGQLLEVLLTMASGLLSALAAELAPMIKLWGDLASQVLPMLLPLITQLISTALPIAVQLGKDFAEAWAPMIPVLVDVVKQLVDGLLPHLPELQQVAMELAPVLADVAKQIGGAMLDAFKRLLPYLPDLIKVMVLLLEVFVKLAGPYLANAFKLLGILATVFITVGSWAAWLVLHIFKIPGAIASLAKGIWGFIKGAGAAIGDFFAMVGGWFKKIPGLLGKAVDGLKGIGGAIIDALGTALQWLADLPGKIGSFLATLPGLVWDALKQAAFLFGFAIGTMVKEALSLPGRIFAALSTLWGIISSAVSSAWDSAVSWTKTKISELVDWATGLPGRISAGISTLWDAINSAVHSAWDSAVSWTATKISELVSWASGLPSRVKNAITNLGGQILNVVTGAWASAKNGFSNGITAAINVAKTLPGKIKDALSGAGSWLYNIGKDVIRGIWDGMQSMFGWLYDKAKSLASSVMSGVKKGLGIGSPSKRMRDEVGRWIPPGIQQGVEMAMPKLDRYLQNTMAGLASRNQPVNVAAPNVSVSQPPVYVLLDKRQLQTMLLDPPAVARANAEGTRQRNYLNTGRTAAA